MTWQLAIERTVTGLGYDLVSVELSAGGLLRVYIDHMLTPGSAALGSDGYEERFITVDDCESVTRQLQHVLEVENFDYSRLEVSSPGLDRPLKKAADYARFTGQQVDLTLKTPFEGRKKYRGELQALGDGWRLLLADDATASGRPAAKRVAKAAPAAPGRALDFSLDEVKEARLVPVVDFKGRRFAAPASSPDAGGGSRTGSADLGNGDRIQ